MSKATGPLSSPPRFRGGLSGRLSTAQLHAPYTGEYELTPRAEGVQILHTANKLLFRDVVIHEIPYFETTNTADGTTVYIAKEVSHGD